MIQDNLINVEVDEHAVQCGHRLRRLCRQGLIAPADASAEDRTTDSKGR